MSRLVWLRFLLFVWSAAPLVWAADPPVWARTLERIGGWLDPAATHPPVVSCHLHLTEAQGLPAGFNGTQADLALQAPGHCRLGWGTNRTRIEFGRVEGRLWLWEPGSNLLYVATLDADSTGVRPTIGLPFSAAVLPWLSQACRWTDFADQVVAKQTCQVSRIWPHSAAREWFGASDFQATVWLRRNDGMPQAVQWREPERGVSVTVWPSTLKVEPAWGPERWQPVVSARAQTVRTTEASLRRRLPPVIGFLAIELGALNKAPER